ncbi:hypothetical protein GF339_00285 [candidate division KSB3 bacterium]|uniref:Cell shape-determining protein MreC n=1 Tax=candidate division KSB3 bacterium TaxID=2044937 RepID=A0A9D5JS56_9BACT|nr:hypothetical protein [candidate division KSB3 bacterium]MBD3322986.1 hypothetical protein [candidate division KSB3 bacterium]
MLHLLSRYRHISLFILFILISVALLSFNRPTDSFIQPSNIMERGMLLILKPFQDAVSWTLQRVNHVWHAYIALVNLSEENRQLREQIKLLQTEKNQYTEKALAYERLKDTLYLVEERQFSTILASVIGHDPTNQSNTIMIDRGADNGVEPSWPVITHDGIVGVTVTVSKTSSKVLLLTDPNCNVAALIQRTRDQGIVGGQGKKDAYIMKYVNRRADIRAGITYRITPQALFNLAKENLPGYLLNDQVFDKLRENGIPEDTLTILEELKGQEYPHQTAFVRALEATIGLEQVNWYKAVILQYARAGVLAQLERLQDQRYATKERFLAALEKAIGAPQVTTYFPRILHYVQEEETVVSSGLGEIFPKGLRIGTVSHVVKRDYGLFQEIAVAPSVDFSKLEEVLIIRRHDR